MSETEIEDYLSNIRYQIIYQFSGLDSNDYQNPIKTEAMRVVAENFIQEEIVAQEFFYEKIEFIDNASRF